MLWRESEPCSRHREYPWTLGSMQIYSSYKYRRDFVEAVKCPGSLARTRPLRVRWKVNLLTLCDVGGAPDPAEGLCLLAARGSLHVGSMQH